MDKSKIFGGKMSNKKEYELPITLQQNIKSYTWYALPLCIIFSIRNYFPWIYKNFIQIKSLLQIREDGNHLEYCFNGNFHEVLDITEIDYSDVHDLIQFIEAHIQNNCYLNCELDEYFIEMKHSYHKKHFIHPSLLYGYNKNKNKNEFKAIGFISEIFKKFTIQYEDLINSIKNCKMVDDLYSHPDFNLQVYKIKPVENQYIFTLHEFKIIIENYLYPSKQNNDEVHGIDVYNVIYQSLNESYKPGLYIKFNTIQFLAEHKKTFKAAMDYIFSTNNIKNDFIELYKEYEEVVQLFEGIRMSHIKLGIKEGRWFFITKKSSAKQLLEEIIPAVNREKEVLKKILSKLENIF